MTKDTDEEVRIREHLKDFIPRRLDEIQMTIADLVRATGDSRKQIDRVARGEHIPSLAFSARVARALGCSLDELSGELVES